MPPPRRIHPPANAAAMNPSRKDNPRQMVLFATHELVPRGDGSYIVKAGKPTQWLSVQAVARELGVSEQAVRDWANSGRVTARRVGLRKLQIEAGSLAEFTEPFNHLK